MLCVIAASRKGYEGLPEQLKILTGFEFVFIGSREALTLDNLHALKPRYVFFPHWSYLINKEIFEGFECVIFHMADVPFGRGGSPLQNLVARKIYHTKITALRCVAELDAGPVYLKRDLCLHGTAEEIFVRAGQVIREMIVEIVRIQPVPQEQIGPVVSFRRRTPSESRINELTDLDQVFDYIRMLDAEGYPRAFLETEHLRFEFERATLKQDHLLADVRIYRKT
ncbi:MAG: methionyl-tRNA formyltransferase [Desulfobulbaceae bacterium]